VLTSWATSPHPPGRLRRAIRLNPKFKITTKPHLWLRRIKKTRESTHLRLRWGPTRFLLLPVGIHRRLTSPCRLKQLRTDWENEDKRKESLLHTLVQVREPSIGSHRGLRNPPLLTEGTSHRSPSGKNRPLRATAVRKLSIKFFKAISWRTSSRCRLTKVPLIGKFQWSLLPHQATTTPTRGVSKRKRTPWTV
jgi:hypothetical protein